MYLGLTTIRAEKVDRKLFGGLVIAFLENLPQFIIQFAEMFIFKTSISFTQAGFPLISLMLIYDVTAPITAILLYNHLLWDGKPSKKNRFG